MTFKANIVNDRGETKVFYMTESSESACLRRLRDTYSIPAERITLVEYYDDVEGDMMAIGDSHIIGYKSKKEQKNNDKASELYFGASKKRGKKKDDCIAKYGFMEIKISSKDELPDILSKYKKVKVYWEPSDKRGEHQYYALVK